MALGLLILRLAVGLALAAHGAQKLFGMFGGRGIAGTAGFFERLGFRPGKAFATLAGASELVGGLSLAIGLLTPLGAALVIATMIVATMAVHLEKGFFAQNGGYELPLVIGVTAAAIAFTGAGAVSFDTLLGLRFAGWWWGIIAIGLGLVGALPPLLMRSTTLRRRPAPNPRAQRTSTGPAATQPAPMLNPLIKHEPARAAPAQSEQPSGGPLIKPAPSPRST